MTDSERLILTRVAIRTEILVKPVCLVCSRRAGAGGRADRAAAATE
jgi:hypothetical protein